MMISFDTAKGHFQARAGAICIKNECLLIHRDRRLQQWAVPGGRIDMGEASHTTLEREMQEELHTPCQVDRLVMVVELIVDRPHDPRGCFHELGWYYVVTLPELAWQAERFYGHAEAVNAEFWWCPLDALDTVTLYPVALKAWMQAGQPAIQHIVETQHVDETGTHIRQMWHIPT
jgi:8-oxo-dGTP pyrophosphatase MutT (NUDIX family)